MDICLVTGSAGLVGSECVRFFSAKGMQTVGIDNNMRAVFFGDDASVSWNVKRIGEEIPSHVHHEEDIRDVSALERILGEYQNDIRLVIHAAAQPSHDWAAGDPSMDFTINANGTLNLLEATRKFCPDAVFIYTSTNKVYGDLPNHLPLVEKESRFEIDAGHPYAEYGIDESMGIDQNKHSVFGASKLAADIMVQEYGRYFNMKTGCFRGGCLTGPAHSGTRLHGFLAYLMKCAVTGAHYTIYGYKGKQVRDNVHSFDLANMFWHFYRSPRPGEVYNAGGGRHANCSILEAIRLCEAITGQKIRFSYEDQHRNGDHIWWISDVRKFQKDFPGWDYSYTLEDILTDLYRQFRERY
ncbi:NAD-dependent epimerase [Desulfosarcina alkanivorans]|uniref:NAD-dependent epimerase n=1 Tax=Desulfosarcina alkanivorans TaxID=571177 RepID=A0A5K7YQ42_9BACT|nr:NAD-dependent epimerase/dehydratase family protein [Desulfosarcina alkanivorans]BBO66737.1 NAD-dependent epimerase [Desulfosarcina alkanivorans]